MLQKILTSKMANDFDVTIIESINFLAQKSNTFDKLLVLVAHNHLIKAATPVALLWFVWFQRPADGRPRHREVIGLLLGCVLAMVTSRSLSLLLPLRLRPLHEPGLGFTLPRGMTGVELDGWSSFPSDHAALFFSMAVGLFWINRFWGSLAILHTLLVVCLPRTYLGLHYPTDLLGGLAVGAVCAWVGRMYFSRLRLVGQAADWAEQRPELFYPLFFLIAYQFADMFMAARQFLGSVSQLLAG
jgi:undecaprenyl-diphosphatase